MKLLYIVFIGILLTSGCNIDPAIPECKEDQKQCDNKIYLNSGDQKRIQETDHEDGDDK